MSEIDQLRRNVGDLREVVSTYTAEIAAYRKTVDNPSAPDDREKLLERAQDRLKYAEALLALKEQEAQQRDISHDREPGGRSL